MKYHPRSLFCNYHERSPPVFNTSIPLSWNASIINIHHLHRCFTIDMISCKNLLWYILVVLQLLTIWTSWVGKGWIYNYKIRIYFPHAYSYDTIRVLRYITFSKITLRVRERAFLNLFLPRSLIKSYPTLRYPYRYPTPWCNAQGRDKWLTY